MHQSSQNSPTAAPNLVCGTPLLSVYSDHLFIVPKASETHPLCSRLVLLHLFLKSLPQILASKKSITPILYPPPLIILVLSGKLSTTYYRKSSSPLPSYISVSSLDDSLATFFTDKISKLRFLSDNSSTSSTASPHSVLIPLHLLPFLPLVLPLNLKSPESCTTVPTSNKTLILFLHGFLNNVLPFSLPSSLILSIYLLAPAIFTLLSQKSTVTPVLNKATLDKEELSNYRPISNPSVISKIIERVVKYRLTEHLSTNIS